MLKTIYQWTSLPRKAYTFLPRCQAVVWRRKPRGEDRAALAAAAAGPRAEPRWI